MPPTIAQLLHAAAERLAGSESPESDAAELLSRLLGCTRAELTTGPPRMPDIDDAARLDRWIERRVAGEPVQYITGRAAFRGLDLAVDQSVLIPRPETEWLVEAVLEVLRDERARWSKPRVLDLGTGSGAIALAIAAEHPEAVVTATDLSPDALDLARANAAATGLAGRVRFLEGDWFDAVPADERFHVVVSNPPYIATGEWDELPEDVKRFEPQVALFAGSSGLEAIMTILDEAPDALVTEGLLALELAETRAHEVAGWLEGARDWADVTLRDDLSGRPRVLLARRQAGPAIAPAQWGEEG